MSVEPRRRWLRWWLEIAIAVMLVAPMIVLLGAGLAWLWQHGWLLAWMLAAAALAVAAWSGLQLRRRHRRRRTDAQQPTLTQADPTWAPHEQAAWLTVQRLSSEADGAILADHRLMLASARQTVDEVARHYHPGHAEPALEFTLPEVLLLTERVSARLRSTLLEQVPWSQRLKVGRMIRVWGYRPMIAAGFEHGRTAYALLRIARAFNPLHAVVGELRDRFIGDLLEDLQMNVRRKIVRVWIEEVGRTAIDLYSGRLRVDVRQHAAAAAAEGLAGAGVEAAAPGSLRMLVAGQTNAGKSTLINGLLGEIGAGVDVLALTAEYEGYVLQQEGLPPAYLIDSPGIENEAGIAKLVERAFACDLVIWVIGAHRADRKLDRAALGALRARFAASPERRVPPLIVVASHIDRLRPVREWAPPYNVDTPASPKEQSIRGALDALAADLDVPVEAIVPMRLDSSPPYNLDALWLRLAADVGEAQRARWVRVLRTAGEPGGWRQAWKQVRGAGRMVGQLVKR